MGAWRTILLVEDSPLTRRMVRRMIEEMENFQVIEATDGAEALELLKTRSVDLILSDLHMCPMDGHMLLMQLRARPSLAHLPFVMMTAQHCPDAISRTVGDQASQYLPKPFTRDQLFQAVERALPRWAA